MKVLYINFNINAQATDGGQLESLEKIRFLSKNFELSILNIISDKRLLYGNWQNGLSEYSNNIVGVNSPEFGLSGLRKILNKLQIICTLLPRFCAHIDKKTITKLDFNPDVMVFGYLPAIYAGQFLKNINRSKTRTFYFSQNVEYVLINPKKGNFLKYAFGLLQKWKTKRFEQKYLGVVDKISVFTETDKVLLEDLTARKDIEVIQPNITYKGGYRKTKPNTVLIATNMEHYPNEESINWFLSEVYPRLETNIQILITGKDKDNQLRNLDLKNIKYLGFVSRNELEGLYKSISAVLNPTISGSGFQMKLLDALAFGTPVISTSFSNHFGDQILSTDDPAVFAELVNKVCRGELGSEINFQEITELQETKLKHFLGIE